MTATAPRTQTAAAGPRHSGQIDASHSSVEFVVRHLMVAKVRGRFAEFCGDIHVGDTPEDSKVVVAISPASITTGDEQRDGHLKSAGLLRRRAVPDDQLRAAPVFAPSATATRWTAT